MPKQSQPSDKAWRTYEFTLLLRGTDPGEHLDALFEAGCGDATFGSREGAHYAEFRRQAPDFGTAVVSAIEAIEGSVPGLRVLRVEPDELVSVASIAERTRRTQESIRLLAEDRRGPGNFPAPLGWINRRTRIWRWLDVADWLLQSNVDTSERVQAALEEGAVVGLVNATLEARDYSARLRDSAPSPAVLRFVHDYSTTTNLRDIAEDRDLKHGPRYARSAADHRASRP